MFHKIARRFEIQPETPASTPHTSPSNLHVMPAPTGRALAGSRLIDLAVIASRRCSAFFAEAAVLVLVFGILDYFMLKGRIELGWILGALAISLGLLAASIAMDFTAHSWVKAHP
jgi:hypothetical protein